MAAFHWFSLFMILSTTICVNAGRSKRSPIVTDDLAGPNEYRHAVAILDKASHYVCSGGIIGEKYILSAAHCFINRTTFELLSDGYAIVAGKINLRSNARGQNSTVARVIKVFVRSNYDSNLRRADIAILELATDLETHKRNLQILNLPSRPRDYVSGEKAEVAAFGTCECSVDGNGKKNSVMDGQLRYARIEIAVETTFRGKHVEPYHLLGLMKKNGSEKYGLCYGDSGASLVQNGNTVIGVVGTAFDEYCDGRTLPSRFTKVSYYLRFVQHVISGGSSAEGMIVLECETSRKRASESSDGEASSSKKPHGSPKRG